MKDDAQRGIDAAVIWMTLAPYGDGRIFRALQPPSRASPTLPSCCSDFSSRQPSRSLR
jgi:hypothetical protein